MKEALFICCNMYCLTKHMIDFAAKIIDTGKGCIPFHQLNTLGDGETLTTFALAENLNLAPPRGVVFDKIETCDHVLLSPYLAAALYRKTAVCGRAALTPGYAPCSRPPHEDGPCAHRLADTSETPNHGRCIR